MQYLFRELICWWCSAIPYNFFHSRLCYAPRNDQYCIEHWSACNYLYLHASTKIIMPLIVSRKKMPTLPENPLQLPESELERVDCYKYLGVILTCNLFWSSHISNICTKARLVQGLLYMRFYGSTSQNSLKQLYLSLMRPHLGYARQVCHWDPRSLGEG